MKAPRRLVLLGGGHAHVHVLAGLARLPLADVEVVLVSPFERHHYSGMVPGFLQGTYRESDLAFDLPAIARRAGARFLRGWAKGIDVAARTVDMGDERVPFDVLSVDVGSEASGMDTPGAREHAFTVRPMSRAVALRERADELFTPGASPAICVVGGGAAGVEVALALRQRAKSRGANPSLSIMESGDGVLAGFSQRVVALTQRALTDARVSVFTGRRVAAVAAEEVTLDDRQRVPANLTVWLTGAAPPLVVRESNLPKDERGYFLVDATLRAVDGAPIFGAGDCIALEEHPWVPKAGVYAVRQSPILDANLRATLTGTSLRPFVPQRTWLSLMNTADGRAILRWHGFVAHTRFAWRLKDSIDRGFMRRYQQ